MPKRLFTDAQAKAIRVRHVEHKASYQLIAKEWNASVPTIRSICMGATYKSAGGPTRRYNWGRKARGNYKNKLSKAKAKKIRERHVLEGVSQSELAREYGVRPTTIRSVCIGRTYRKAGGPILHTANKQRGDDMRKFKPDEVITFRERIANGETCAKLAKETGVSREAMSSIARGYLYRDVGGPLLPPGSPGTWVKTAKLRTEVFLDALGFTQDAVGWSLELEQGWLRVDAERSVFRLVRGLATGEVIDVKLYRSPKHLLEWFLRNLRDLLAKNDVEVQEEQEVQAEQACQKNVIEVTTTAAPAPSKGNGDVADGAWRI